MEGFEWIKKELHNAWYEVAECYDLAKNEQYLYCHRANDNTKSFKIAYDPKKDMYFVETVENSDNRYIVRQCISQQMLMCSQDKILFLDMFIEQLFQIIR